MFWQCHETKDEMISVSQMFPLKIYWTFNPMNTCVVCSVVVTSVEIFQELTHFLYKIVLYSCFDSIHVFSVAVKVFWYLFYLRVDIIDADFILGVGPNRSYKNKNITQITLKLFNCITLRSRQKNSKCFKMTYLIIVYSSLWLYSYS